MEKIMSDPLEQQLVNELRSIFKSLNERYGEFFHVNLITLIDLKEDPCAPCKINNVQCKRCVIGVEEHKEMNVTEPVSSPEVVNGQNR
jgi:hypothetical protein